MQGNQAHATLRYRCVTTQTRALPAYLADHPKALYLREDAIIEPLDEWIASLADPEWLAATQDPEPAIAAQHASLQTRLAEIDKATGNLVAAIEAGTDPAAINPRLNQLRTERETLTGQLTAADIDALITEVGGVHKLLAEATPTENVALYQSLGLHLVYQPDQNAVVATADLAVSLD